VSLLFVYLDSMVPSPNLREKQMFRQVLDFFLFGFVDPDPKEL